MTKKIDLLGRHSSYVLETNSGYYQRVETKKREQDSFDLPREFKILDSKFKTQKNEVLLILEGKEKSPWGNPYFRTAIQEIANGLAIFVIKKDSDLHRYKTFKGLLFAISDDRSTIWVYRLGEAISKSHGDAIQEFTARVKNRYSRV